MEVVGYGVCAHGFSGAWGSVEAQDAVGSGIGGGEAPSVVDEFTVLDYAESVHYGLSCFVGQNDLVEGVAWRGWREGHGRGVVILRCVLWFFFFGEVEFDEEREFVGDGSVVGVALRVGLDGEAAGDAEAGVGVVGDEVGASFSDGDVVME